MSSSLPRIVVVGCGQWGRNHVRTLHGIGALAGVADRSPERAAALAAEFGVPALSPDAAIEGDAADALVLALPAQAHGPAARSAIAAGKDVLVEKPVALDAADARLTAEAARAAGRILMVGHVLRHHPIFRALQAEVEAGAVGTVRHVVSNRMGLGRFLGMDAVWDLAPHDVSLILAIAGRSPERVGAARRTVLSDETDEADIDFNFSGGLTAAIRVSRVSPYRDRRFSVVGNEGMITFDDLAPAGAKLALYRHRVRREGAHFAFAEAQPSFLPEPAGLPLEAELRHFIDCVATRRPPLTGAEEAVETVRILQLASPLRG
ncbi:Gfo/Idh/MocA family protein [Antarcticirhabdus aurantiaca]|uniref:Gfo/Idh/MocA family oxidoreductase n=1 Tax=Antarcticirhabdus aurantiaca TaxID=2606717 RepID=A0ACD4NJQ2_9HYPH|nr:Gfo/Idh/MocA family oxidoreductase [Antarcticirhabdus aurantiaca]WAJ27030.1 Gfo/Idh/MocA family oxidoreductase [Jeongeuplla avenae]